MKKEAQKKVYVGLSGGVDSSVSAYLLQQQGYDVTGVFIKVWQPDFLKCTWPEDRRDAMRVCAQLNIPFKTLDLEDVYKREVVDYMIEEYKEGRTPNPDVMCNRSVKFGAFLEWAKKEGADFVATGHYAQIKKQEKKDGEAKLYTSVDTEKDQTYFLWQLRESDLDSILFPVGHLTKSETRKRAAQAGFNTATKKDSQGLCFLGKLDMKEFLSHFVEKEEGEVVTEDGKIIGKHMGALFYTLGERHGFTVSDNAYKMPLYVVGKDMERNQVIVSPQSPDCATQNHEIELHSCNWIHSTPVTDKQYFARVRHGGQLLPVTVRFHENSQGATRALLCGVEGLPLISSGQSVVLYEAAEDGIDSYICLGGGVVA